MEISDDNIHDILIKLSASCAVTAQKICDMEKSWEKGREAAIADRKATNERLGKLENNIADLYKVKWMWQGGAIAASALVSSLITFYAKVKDAL
jgi:hypothetical protein